MKAFKNKMKWRHGKMKVFWTINSMSYQKQSIRTEKSGPLKNIYCVGVYFLQVSQKEKCKIFPHQFQIHHSTKQNFYYHTHTIKCPEVYLSWQLKTIKYQYLFQLPNTIQRIKDRLGGGELMCLSLPLHFKCHFYPWVNVHNTKP